MTAETLIDRLDKVKATAPDRWLARCPAHNDVSPSLSIRLIDDRVLVKCFSGCAAADVMAAAGLEMHDLLEDKACSGCGQFFHPFHPDHDKCPKCFRGDQGTYHRQKPTRRRIPARDILEALDFEALVVSVIAADFREHKDITPEQWDRLALAAQRIGNARDMR